jgi:2-hydroxychromene-2-carboxylate isomerase
MMVTGRSLDFWFDFGSTYSYPTSQRIQALARAADIEVRFRPFMLGAIFKAQGWDTSPFNIYPAKGRYMWRDLQRICDDLKIPLIRPDTFPQNSLLAARVAIAAAEEQWVGDYCVEVFREQFGKGNSISDDGVIHSVIGRFNQEPQRFIERAAAVDVKERLRAETAMAQEIGIFGAPAFVTGDGELFWGNDRLETAVAWSLRPKTGSQL